MDIALIVVARQQARVKTPMRFGFVLTCLTLVLSILGMDARAETVFRCEKNGKLNFTSAPSGGDDCRAMDLNVIPADPREAEREMENTRQLNAQFPDKRQSNAANGDERRAEGGRSPRGWGSNHHGRRRSGYGRKPSRGVGQPVSKKISAQPSKSSPMGGAVRKK